MPSSHPQTACWGARQSCQRTAAPPGSTARPSGAGRCRAAAAQAASASKHAEEGQGRAEGVRGCRWVGEGGTHKGKHGHMLSRQHPPPSSSHLVSKLESASARVRQTQWDKSHARGNTPHRRGAPHLQIQHGLDTCPGGDPRLLGHQFGGELALRHTAVEPGGRIHSLSVCAACAHASGGGVGQCEAQNKATQGRKEIG